MKTFTFTVDDNIRVFRELTEGYYESLFDHPYLALMKRLHGTYRLKIQLNLFYEDERFTLCEMTDRYKREFSENSDWLKLSFHSRKETVKPYENASGEEVAADSALVHREILRFAGKKSLAETATVHYCLATNAGLRALKQNGVRGLLGLYGTPPSPRSSYQNTRDEEDKLRAGEIVQADGIAYAAIDLIVNQIPYAALDAALTPYLSRERLAVMIHEQYFYPDYRAFQPDFAAKLDKIFMMLTKHGFESVFLEECLSSLQLHKRGTQ